MGRIAEVFKTEGLMGVIKRTKAHFYSTQYLLKAEISAIIDHSGKDKYFEFTIIDNDIIDRLSKEYPEEFSEGKREIFQSSIRNPDLRGIVLVKKGILFGFVWTSVHFMEEGKTGYRKELKEDEVYLYDLYIFEGCRRQGAADALCREQMNYYKNKGYKWALTLVDDYNKPSLKAMGKLGLKKIGKIHGNNFKKRKQ